MDFGALETVGTIGGLIAAGLIAFGQIMKANRTQHEQSRKDLMDVVDSQKLRLDALKEDLNFQKGQALELRDELTSLRTDNQLWVKRNQYLYRLCLEWRTRLAAHGEIVPEPNGEDIGL